MECTNCDKQCPNFNNLDKNYFCGLSNTCIQGQLLDPKTGYQNAVFRRTTGKGYVMVDPKNPNIKIEPYSGEKYGGAFSISAAVRPPYAGFNTPYGCGRCRGMCGCNCNSGAPCDCPYILGVS